MPTSIPYDSSLTLMSVVNQEVLKSVKAITALQAPVDAAQDALDSLISSKRSLTMTKTELKNLGVGTDALDEELKNLNAAVEASAGAYAATNMAAEPQITAIRKDIHYVHKQIESPVDYLRSEIRTIALANDTMNMDVQYFSFDSNSQNSATYSAQIASYVSGAVSSVFGAKQSMRIGNAASRQVSRQVSSHSTHDYVVNKYETKDFVAGRTRSSEGLWRKVHTKGFDAVIWEFNPRTIQRPYPFYVPCPAGPDAKRLPVYIRIEAKNKEHQSLFQDDLKKDFFVSLFALIVLGSQQEINWSRETKQMESESELSAWQNLEEEFLKRSNDWKPNFMEGFPNVPVRTETDDIDTVRLSKEWQGWHDVLPQMGILDTTSKHGGKPVRHLNVALRSPILIKPLKSRHEAMISKRFSMTPDKFFQVLIDAIHKTSDPDSPDPNHYPRKLQIHPEQKQEGYIMTSHDPFNLYETYVHQADWNIYMASLEKTGSPIRPFPRVNQKLYDLCNGIMLKVGGADITLQASMKKERGKSHDSEDEDLKSLKEKYPKKVPRPFNNLKAKARALAEKKREKRKKTVKAFSKVYEVGCGTAILWNDLDVDKIQRAAGKRPDEAGQKEIMGGVSATEIGSAMGWGSKRLESRVFPAEWLHLSAFSWGGISSDDDPEGFSTSQNFENLVFGTSETNSLMTRYETAWQRFFLAESELSGSGAKNTGTLDICCNDYDSPILWDVSPGSGQFRTGVLRFTKEDLEAMKKNGFNSNKYLSIKEKKLTDSYIKEQMLVLAHDFPFLVYSIQYDLQADFHSRIFALDNMECSVPFFPFRRPFYHLSEALLDDLVFKELCGKAKAESEVLRSNL